MTHVSSKKLSPEVFDKLFGNLVEILGEAKDKKYLPSVLNELFSDTEKIMFAKRMAIVLMLDNELPQYRITEILKVSPTTVAKASLGIEVGKYDNLLKVSKKEKVNFEKLVWGILTVGGIMPPPVGGKYWRKFSKENK